MLPAFVMNEICVGSASGNDATTSQEPDRHASPASSGSDVPQEWVSNLKDQRPRSNTAKPKSDLWQSYNIGLPPVGQQNAVSFKIPWKPIPDYNDKKGKVVMINPFTMEDPSKELVVDQLVRPHLYQDVHSLTRTSRLNPIAPSYTPSYIKSSEEVNYQAKEVKRLDDKEENARVTPGGTSLFRSDSVLYTDNNEKSDHNDHSDAGNVQISPRINTGFDSSLVRDRKSYNDQVLKNVQKIRDNINC